MGQECTTCLRGAPGGSKNMQDLDLSKRIVDPIKQVLSKFNKEEKPNKETKDPEKDSKEVQGRFSPIDLSIAAGVPVQQHSIDSSKSSNSSVSISPGRKRFIGKLQSKLSSAALETVKTLKHKLNFSNEDAAYEMPDGSIYSGEFSEEGAKHGEGIEISAEGSVFKGGFVKGLKEGPGLMVLSNGDHYVGSFKKGQMDGKGKYVSIEGAVYTGQFKKDVKHGFGKEELPDGSSYEGFFEDGAKNGHGKFVWKDGSVYEGDFVEDRIEGKGIYVWANGKRFDGEWNNNQMHGFGVFTWNSGRKYEGQYKGDVKDGLGKLTYPDGRIYDGQWVKGQQHGTAYYTFLNKKTKKYVTRKGRWEDGARVEWLKD